MGADMKDPLNIIDFILERQTMWHQMEVLEELPYTTDIILASRRFTNVQRELDRGTWCLRLALEAHRGATPAEKVLNEMLHLLLRGGTQALDMLGWQDGKTVPGILSVQRQLKTWGLPFVGRAGQARAPRPADIGLSSKEELHELPRGEPLAMYFEAIIRKWLAEGTHEKLAAVCASADSLEAVFDEACAITNRFGAMQIALNTTYSHEHLTDDEWVFFHHGKTNSKTADRGSLVGLMEIATYHPGRYRNSTALELAREIVKDQDRLFPGWAGVACPAKPRLTLADLEHASCEYSKYRRIRGATYSPSRYTPSVGRKSIWLAHRDQLPDKW
jgi:hypothetical protein